jgi:hypothetical protein
MNEDTSKAKFIISFAKFLLICCWMTVGRIARELWWTNQEFYHVCIIPPWLSMLISPGGGIMGPFVAAVQRRSLTPIYDSIIIIYEVTENLYSGNC